VARREDRFANFAEKHRNTDREREREREKERQRERERKRERSRVRKAIVVGSTNVHA